ncbi:S-adenosyl-L-methionine-dependent methyltransferase [Parathielavia hyrcaniae]|uniref:S-adenosyl-L-methionine-dependent methyltransferase n=1 Tax=Parathielavia hyrcaniae TaxID=113614 RepID=A0AAN6SXM6_9PEZI|nr:S-adenosyl-L-methionine-dependent methyltransferase [Parathielavia hyrcaniae]
MFHAQWLAYCNGRLVLCSRKRFRRVLDIGTGTGIWAIDFADEYPEACVIGVDISSIQPRWVPPNCEFQVDNLELDWTWTQHFDLIHARMLGGCFRNPGSIFKQAYENLEPGGHFEVKDVLLMPRCDDWTLKEDSPLLLWAGLLTRAANNMGRHLDLTSRYQQMLVEAGSTDVHVVEGRWPTNRWAKEPDLCSLGLWSELTLGGELETISMALFTYGLHWDPKAVLVLCAFARRELLNPEVHAYFPVFTAFGMKPLKISG